MYLFALRSCDLDTTLAVFHVFRLIHPAEFVFEPWAFIKLLLKFWENGKPMVTSSFHNLSGRGNFRSLNQKDTIVLETPISLAIPDWLSPSSSITPTILLIKLSTFVNLKLCAAEK